MQLARMTIGCVDHDVSHARPRNLMRHYGGNRVSRAMHDLV